MTTGISRTDCWRICMNSVKIGVQIPGREVEYSYPENVGPYMCALNDVCCI